MCVQLYILACTYSHSKHSYMCMHMVCVACAVQEMMTFVVCLVLPGSGGGGGDICVHSGGSGEGSQEARQYWTF